MIFLHLISQSMNILVKALRLENKKIERTQQQNYFELYRSLYFIRFSLFL